VEWRGEGRGRDGGGRDRTRGRDGQGAGGRLSAACLPCLSVGVSAIAGCGEWMSSPSPNYQQLHSHTADSDADVASGDAASHSRNPSSSLARLMGRGKGQASSTTNPSTAATATHRRSASSAAAAAAAAVAASITGSSHPRSPRAPLLSPDVELLDREHWSDRSAQMHSTRRASDVQGSVATKQRACICTSIGHNRTRVKKERVLSTCSS
jgi:hypothetical protein